MINKLKIKGLHSPNHRHSQCSEESTLSNVCGLCVPNDFLVIPFHLDNTASESVGGHGGMTRQKSLYKWFVILLQTNWLV